MEQVTQRNGGQCRGKRLGSRRTNAQSSTLMEVVRQLSVMVGGVQEADSRPRVTPAWETSTARQPAHKKASVTNRTRLFKPSATLANPFPMDDEFKAMV